MRRFDLLQPTSVEETVALLGQYGEDARLLGGGAMLSILLRERLIAPKCLISVTDIPGLAGIDSDPDGLAIGGAATLHAIERSTLVRERWPVVAEAAHLIGNVRVRNVATMGGHLAQADVHLDLPPVLVGLNAQVEVHGPRGKRTVPVRDFFTGYYETVLATDEVIVSLRVPAATAGLQGVYLKYCSLSPNDWPTVGVAAFMRANNGRAADVRVVVGSVSERPLRLADTEGLLEGEMLTTSAIAEVGRHYAAAADPLPDARGSADYKREVAAVFVRRAIAAAAARVGLEVPA